MAGKEQIEPRYAETFRCVGAECTDTCCVGWQVLIDRATYAKYQKLPDLLPILNTKLWLNPNAGDSNYAQVKLDGDRCPFLAEDRLCDIQKTHGAELLSKTCSEFPRGVRVDGNVTKKTLFLSCPEAARIVLLDPKLLPEEETGGGTYARYHDFLMGKEKNSRKRTNSLDCLWKLQRFSVVLLKDRRYPLWQRLFVLGMFCKRLQDLAVAQQPEQVPGLLDNYAQMIVDKRLMAAMESVQARPAVQLDVTWKFITHRLQQSQASSFRESVADFLAGVPFDGGIIDQPEIAATMAEAMQVYEAAHTEYYRPVMEAHPFLLENYLSNYILQRGFLSPGHKENNAHDILTEYFILCTHYVVIRTMLIGIAAHYCEQFSTQHVVKLVQGFSKAAEHSATFTGEVAKFVSDSGLNRPGEMATLLR
jgi:lysine-N-methylase